MKTQRMKKLSVLAAILLMVAGSNLYAQKGRGLAAQENRKNFDRSCYLIPDLTEDQENKIEVLRVDNLKEMNTLRNQMGELRARKHTLMSSDNSDMKEINSVIDQMTDVHNKMMKTSAKHQQSVRGLLTEEQKVYFDSRPMGDHHGKGGRNARGGRGMHGYGTGYGLNN